MSKENQPECDSCPSSKESGSLFGKVDAILSEVKLMRLSIEGDAKLGIKGVVSRLNDLEKDAENFKAQLRKYEQESEQTLHAEKLRYAEEARRHTEEVRQLQQKLEKAEKYRNENKKENKLLWWGLKIGIPLALLIGAVLGFEKVMTWLHLVFAG